MMSAYSSITVIHERQKMDTTPDRMELRRRLAETIAWCRLHASIDNPQDCLRTPSLRPSNLRTEPNEWGYFEYDWGTLEKQRAVVSALAEKRAALLREANTYSAVIPPDLAGGRLLIASPEDSLWCGASRIESLDFIGDSDILPWDTWVMYLQVTRPLEHGRTHTLSCILCWIPPEFIELVKKGMEVDPVGCFSWATEYKSTNYNAPLLQQLKTAGLLR
ncbi:hypothetical protein LBMAG21_07400 [Armatimonadota bacterium]|nr:hypothetical protein LBMAG21_07400 [Armatimonadota bacterium]